MPQEKRTEKSGNIRCEVVKQMKKNSTDSDKNNNNKFLHN